MSTNSVIMVKINDSDKGKMLSLKKKLLPFPILDKEVDFKLMCNRATKEDYEKAFKEVDMKAFHKIKLIGNYIAIYHHWDGYPTALGRELLDNYNSYEKALNLMSLGNCSSIMSGGFNDRPNFITPYALGHDCKDQWNEEAKPKLLDKPNDWRKQYTYVFENNQWYVIKKTRMIKLTNRTKD